MNEKYSDVTSDFYVDQYDNVYNAAGIFYCKFNTLSGAEKKLVKQNQRSAA